MNKDPFKVVSALLLFAGLTPWSSPLMVQASVAEVHAQQQSNVCNGLVTDQHGEPIIGAAVVIKGTTKGSVTGLDGEFSIANASKGATIVISYIGYVSQEKVWNGKAMKIVLEERYRPKSWLGIITSFKFLGYETNKITPFPSSESIILYLCVERMQLGRPPFL